MSVVKNKAKNNQDTDFQRYVKAYVVSVATLIKIFI